MRMHRDAARGTEAEDAERAGETERKKKSARGRVNERFFEIVARYKFHGCGDGLLCPATPEVTRDKTREFLGQIFW